MAYNDFNLRQVKKDFGLTLIERKSLFAEVAEVEVSENLKTSLADKPTLAISIGTERARSEFIVADILIEVWRIFNRQIGLFSGNTLEVDRNRGLAGRFDYFLTLSPSQLILSAPIIAVVEAKNEDIVGGLGQCTAEMIAAQIFNEQEQEQIPKIYGAVTSGDDWKFLYLDEKTVFIDLDEYSITQPNKIIGILCAMIQQKA